MCYVVLVDKDNEGKYICYLHDKMAAETFCLDVQLLLDKDAKVAEMPLLDVRELRIPYVEQVWKELHATRSF